jgi:hypothetical protein
MQQPISASMLYNVIQCPKRLALDLFGDAALLPRRWNQLPGILTNVSEDRNDPYVSSVIQQLGRQEFPKPATPELSRKRPALVGSCRE